MGARGASGVHSVNVRGGEYAPGTVSVSRRRRRPPLIRLLVSVGAALVVAAGCQVKTDVALRMDEDGSGTVTVTVDLDKEAAAKVPDLEPSS